MLQVNPQRGRDHFRHRLCWWPGAVACALFLIFAQNSSAESTPSSADDQPRRQTESLEELRSRLEQLENANRELRVALSKNSDQPLVPLLSESTVASLPPSPAEPESETNQPPQFDRIESLVDGMIHRMNAESKAADDARSKRISSLESQLEKYLKKNPQGAKAAFGNGGLVFTSNDGNFKTHFGGTIHMDFIAPQSTANDISGYGPPNANLTQDAVNLRRLRTRADGTMYEWIDWVLETEYSSNVQNLSNAAAAPADGLRNVGTAANAGNQAGNSVNGIQPANCWVTFKEIPYAGNIRVGNQLDWLSMDHVMGARAEDFMERAPLIDVLTGPNNNGFSNGVSVFNNTPDKSAGLALGVYKNNAYDAAFPFSIGNAFTYGGRAVWTPFYDEASDGRYMVHTAFGAEYRTFDTTLAANQTGENVRVRSRGDLRIVSSQLTPNFADTGNFFAEDQSVFVPEFAVVWGPLTFQAEYGVGWFYGARTTQLAGGRALNDVMISSGYAEVLYFLTGEHKKYDHQRRAFGQVIPKNDFKPSEGKYGAWQLGARYDWTDLNSGLITGGRNENGTLGLNWFLNPKVRFQFNTVLSYVDNASNPVIAGPVGSAAIGTLQGSKFTGDGLIVTVGTRLDINF